ncbi:MAG: DUF3783 domain-containing protein [Treponema sp.]|nr:DUF3783 domain-containing protein [Treponema sp.]
MEDPVVFFHGFEEKELFAMIDALKKAASGMGLDAKAIAFASSTPVNRKWKIRDLVREVRREHEMMSGGT